MEHEDSTEKIVEEEESGGITQPLSPAVPDLEVLPPGRIIVDERGTLIYPPERS